MNNCRICGEEMTQDGVVHPRLDCNGTCMYCCATVAEFPYHIHHLIAWDHRLRMMDKLNARLSIIGKMMEIRKERIDETRALWPHLNMYHRKRMREYAQVHAKLSYYWDQFSIEKKVKV